MNGINEMNIASIRPLSPDRGAALVRAIVLALLVVLLSQGPVEAESSAVVSSGPRASGGVALTFDDGWGESSCESIARTLRRMDATGTFFINGVHLNAEPARWRRILAGFPVANHTRSHPNLTLLSTAKIRQQIQTDEWIHERVLRRPMLKLLRPPYGAQDEDVRRVASRLGYKRIVLWTLSAADTSSRASASSIIRRTTGGRPGSIILMHCARAATAEALPAVIRHYQRRGIRLIGLDEMFGLGRFRRR